MIETVWLITDAATGDVAYIRHGAENDEPNWRTIGPFAYTKEDAACAAAEEPDFLPKGVEGLFEVQEVECSGFVQAIFNGFPPSNTDVFYIDGSLLPLTAGGAAWVDEAFGHPIWGPAFEDEGGGVGWLDRVLKQVAGKIDMNMETVQAIGSLNAAAEDVAATVEQTNLLVKEHVRVAIVPEEGTMSLDNDDENHQLSPAAKFWLHTNGLAKFGIPELEIRNVPAWYVVAAGAELNGWSAYAIDQGIADGDTLDGGGPVPLTLSATESTDPFWAEQGRECLRLEVKAVRFAVGHKRHGKDGASTVH